MHCLIISPTFIHKKYESLYQLLIFVTTDYSQNIICDHIYNYLKCERGNGLVNHVPRRCNAQR